MSKLTGSTSLIVRLQAAEARASTAEARIAVLEAEVAALRAEPTRAAEEDIARAGFNAWYGRPAYDEFPEVHGMWKRVAAAIRALPIQGGGDA